MRLTVDLPNSYDHHTTAGALGLAQHFQRWYAGDDDRDAAAALVTVAQAVHRAAAVPVEVSPFALAHFPVSSCVLPPVG